MLQYIRVNTFQGENDAVQPESWLCTNADLNDLAAIRNFVEECAADLDADRDVVSDLLLAVTEVVTNIIVHGYKGEPGLIELTVSRAGNALIVRVCDHAPSFDPTTLSPPDLSLPLEQRRLGGLGVYLTNDLMDDVIHRTPDEGGNELILVKRCTP